MAFWLFRLFDLKGGRSTRLGAAQGLRSRPTTVSIENSVGVGDWLRQSRGLWTIFECSGKPRDLLESLELSIVRIGLETTFVRYE